MKRLILSWTISLLGATSFFAQNPIPQSGDLFTKIDTLLDNIPDEFVDNYIPPTSNELDNWEILLQNLWIGDYSTASSFANALNYFLIEFTATTGELYYILESQKVNGNFWGTYVFNPNSCQTNIVIQSPHPRNDLRTGLQGVHVFEQVGLSFFMVAGTHRCNSTCFSACSGTTSTCTGSSEKFRITDMAHMDSTIYQRTTEFLFQTIPDVYFLQLHGFGWSADSGLPYLILSNGTTISPTEDKISQLGDALVTIDPTLTYGVAHVDSSLPLKGTTNTQGRFINNSPDPCGTAANMNTGRFFHIEQGYSRLRKDITGWQKMEQAIKMTFRNIDISFSYLHTGHYQAQDTLIVESVISFGEIVELKAAQCIDLQANFEVELGAELSIEIVSCSE